MGLIRIDATAEVLRGLHDIPDLYLVKPTVVDLGADRYRVSAYAPESVIPELEARGAEVRVLMSTQAIDQFHNEVANDIAPPPPDT